MSHDGTRPKKGGCFKKFCIGCLTVLVLMAVGSFFAYRGAKTLVTKMTADYTAAAPAELPAVQVPDAERDALAQRVASFAKAVREGLPAPDLALTARDLNVLIQNEPAVSNKLHVAIDGDRIQSDVSIPLEDFGGYFKGRWLNGSASFRVDTAAGRLLVFMDSLSVRGKAVPDQFMAAIRSKNLAEKAFENPKSAEVLQKIDSIAVRDGKLVIKAK